MMKATEDIESVSTALPNETLTKKASLNTVAAGLDYGARLTVGLWVTPLLVAGLGDFYYGAWQMLLRLIGYISPASGRPTQALKMTLANQLRSTDYDKKRRGVGSALAVWALFLPVVGTVGGLVAWFVPYWIHSAVDHVWPVRLAAALLVGNLAMSTLAAVPQSVLEGENLAYKRMGLSTFLVLAGGSLTWLALYLNLGIAGVAGATLATTVIMGIFYLQVARTYAAWFGIARPTVEATRQFLGLSWWFLAWNLISNAMVASDVVVLGFLDSVKSVTDYTLTKYAPETLINIVAIIVFGISPGLGGIIGTGDMEKANRLRSEIMALTWLVVTALGTTILFWNRTFVQLWVGAQHFGGTIPALLIAFTTMQFILIRNDGNFIDLTLRLRRKVILGGLSVVVSLAASAALVGYFHLGIEGLCLGLILGRFILTIGYPIAVGRLLALPLSSQLRAALRPATVTITLFLAASFWDRLSSSASWHLISGWFSLAVAVGVTSTFISLLAFYTGLSKTQRNRIWKRARYLLTVVQVS
jgi:O-antigen/teichoic acid export membrane protein